MAALREIQRTMLEFYPTVEERAAVPGLSAYQRRLLKPPEHNWGLSVGKYLPSLRSKSGNWSNAAFHAVRGRRDYQFLEQGWREQRQFLYPLNASGFQKFWSAAAPRVEALRHPVRPNMSGLVPAGASPRRCGAFAVSVNATDGSISSLVHRATSREWAGQGHPLGKVVYQTFVEDDFNTLPCRGGDFRKQGMDSAEPESRTWEPHVVGTVLVADGAESCRFVSQLDFDAPAHVKYGAASEFFLELTVGESVDVRLSWCAWVWRSDLRDPFCAFDPT